MGKTKTMVKVGEIRQSILLIRGEKVIMAACVLNSAKANWI